MTTARDALKEFYRVENLPEHGNLTVWIDWVTMFGIPLPLPNIFGRTKILPYHDLHHLVTGYHTDEVGECEVGAWCMATGRGPLLGHIYDGMTTTMGFLRFPKRTLAAWRWGRQCTNLYAYPLEELLDMEVDELRRLVDTLPRATA